VERLSSRLGRLLEPVPPEIFGHGPSSQMLAKLSTEQPRNTFQATKAYLKKDLDQRILSARNDTFKGMTRTPVL
jgi:hypothetical protein